MSRNRLSIYMSALKFFLTDFSLFPSKIVPVIRLIKYPSEIKSGSIVKRTVLKMETMRSLVTICRTGILFFTLKSFSGSFLSSRLIPFYCWECWHVIPSTPVSYLWMYTHSFIHLLCYSQPLFSFPLPKTHPYRFPWRRSSFFWHWKFDRRHWGDRDPIEISIVTSEGKRSDPFGFVTSPQSLSVYSGDTCRRGLRVL